MSTIKTFDEPSEVHAEDGVVIVDGPDGVAFSMTFEAASETGERLLRCAAEARGQQMLAKDRTKARPLQ